MHFVSTGAFYDYVLSYSEKASCTTARVYLQSGVTVGPPGMGEIGKMSSEILTGRIPGFPLATTYFQFISRKKSTLNVIL